MADRSDDRLGLSDLALSAFVAVLAVVLAALTLEGCRDDGCDCECYTYGRTFDNDVRMCVIGLTELESRIDMLEGRVEDLEEMSGDVDAGNR